MLQMHTERARALALALAARRTSTTEPVAPPQGSLLLLPGQCLACLWLCAIQTPPWCCSGAFSACCILQGFFSATLMAHHQCQYWPHLHGFMCISQALWLWAGMSKCLSGSVLSHFVTHGKNAGRKQLSFCMVHQHTQ